MAKEVQSNPSPYPHRPTGHCEMRERGRKGQGLPNYLPEWEEQAVGYRSTGKMGAAVNPGSMTKKGEEPERPFYEFRHSVNFTQSNQAKFTTIFMSTVMRV